MFPEGLEQDPKVHSSVVTNEEDRRDHVRVRARARACASVIFKRGRVVGKDLLTRVSSSLVWAKGFR